MGWITGKRGGAIALAKAMLTLKEIGFETIIDHEADLASHLLQGLIEIEGVRVFGETDPTTTRDRLGVVSLVVDGISHYLVAAILSVEYGIGVRNGRFCAHPYLIQLMRIDEEESDRHWKQAIEDNRADLPGLVRVSFGMFNTKAEIDWFLEALRAIVAQDYKGQYHQDIRSGDFIAEGFQPDIRAYFSL
jgi:cysteine desulfurase/selenocysteine lyase